MTYNENQSEIVRSNPLERVRLLLVEFPICTRLDALLDQNITDEAVNHARAHGCILLRPQENARGGDDFERVQGRPRGFSHDER